MYGGDIEKTISQIGAIIAAGRAGLNSLASAADTAVLIETEGSHTHSYTDADTNGGGSGGTKNTAAGSAHTHTEKEGTSFSISIPGLDIKSITELESSLYQPKEQINNSIGSPYTELYALSEALGNNSGGSGLLGGRIAALCRLTNIVNCAVDAKHALITYHDSIQRGFDSRSGKESIVIDNFPDKPNELPSAPGSI